MTSGSFDFRRPPPGESERLILGWLTLACRGAAGAWGRNLPFPTELTPGPVEGVAAITAVASLPDDAVAFPVTTADAADGTLLLALRRPLLLALLGGLLGETPLALPADRDPTDLEASLVPFLLRELLLDPLEKGWTGPDPLKLTVGSVTAPKAVWPTAGEELAVSASLTLAAPFGEASLSLLIPRSGRWERTGRAAARSRPADAAIRAQIEALVREMTVDLDVVLGTADLTMHDLARLKAGDLVVLRQKVDQPLDGLVEGARKFRVWPGVVGSRTAVMIDAPAGD